MFGYVELPIVLSYLLRCLVYHMLSKTTNSRSLHSDGVYLLYLLRCLVYHMLFKTRRNSGRVHRVICEVLVLSLLVVYKIPYSSCILLATSCFVGDSECFGVHRAQLILCSRVLPRFGYRSVSPTQKL